MAKRSTYSRLTSKVKKAAKSAAKSTKKVARKVMPASRRKKRAKTSSRR
jgi:hypothetical protein